jgi:hypothetical protein
MEEEKYTSWQKPGRRHSLPSGALQGSPFLIILQVEVQHGEESHSSPG